MLPHITIDDSFGGDPVLKILSGEFSGRSFSYGKVEFDKVDEGILHFELNLLSSRGEVQNVEKELGEEGSEKFKQLAGDYLIHLIELSIETGNLPLKGGK